MPTKFGGLWSQCRRRHWKGPELEAAPLLVSLGLRSLRSSVKRLDFDVGAVPDLFLEVGAQRPGMGGRGGKRRGKMEGKLIAAECCGVQRIGGERTRRRGSRAEVEGRSGD